MLQPESRFRENWDLLIALLTLCALVEIPLRLALGYHPRSARPVLSFEILLTLCFSADIFINFSTRIAGRSGPATGKAIARRYLRRGFVPDVLAAIPFFLFFPAVGFGGFRLLKAGRLAHLGHLFKIGRLIGVFRNWRVSHRLSPGLFRLGCFFVGISLFAHWAACGWIVLTDQQSYLDALYWTVTTLTTVGYGDITPESGPQKIYTMVVMIAGAGSYGYIIGNFASLLANLDLVRAGQLRKTDQVEAFLKHQNVPPDLHRRVREFYEHLFSSHSAVGSEAVINELPAPLKTEIALHMHRGILKKVPFFKNAGEDFLREIVPKLRPVVEPPDSRVVRYGQAGNAMYFISSGKVEILDRDETVRETLSEGDYFGEMALVLNAPRSATVRCRGFCEFYVLSREDFEDVLALFPAFAEDVRRTTRDRLETSDDQETGAER